MAKESHLDRAIKKSLAPYRGNGPVSYYREKRQSHEDDFKAKIKAWLDQYSKPGFVRVRDVAMNNVPEMRKLAMSSLMNIHLQFVLADLTSFTFMLRAQDVPAFTAERQLYVQWKETKQFVFKHGWDICAVPHTAGWFNHDSDSTWQTWRAIEESVDNFIPETLIPVLEHRRTGAADFNLAKMVEAVKKGALEAIELKSAPPKAQVPVDHGLTEQSGEDLNNRLTSKASRKGDDRLLTGKELVTFETAENYLGITKRQRQKLVKALSLTVKGKGHNRKITTESLRNYLPPQKAN